MKDYTNKINQLKADIEIIEAKQRELKAQRANKISELDKLLYAEALDSLPFPPGTKVKVYYIKDYARAYERMCVCFVGYPKPSVPGKYQPTYMVSDKNGLQTRLIETSFTQKEIIKIEKV